MNRMQNILEPLCPGFECDVRSSCHRFISEVPSSIMFESLPQHEGGKCIEFIDAESVVKTENEEVPPTK
jgi:hypothetical protein